MKSRSMLLLLPTLAILLLADCSTFVAKTYRLEQIHETYTSEWVKADLTRPSTSPGVPKATSTFGATLEAIRNYKTQYGADTREAAHLTVLEGMIHLQSGSPGMARLLIPEVETAKGRLRSSGGTATRDSLFAECYPELVAGWSAVFGGNNDDTSVVAKDFLDAAEGIREKLGRIKLRERALANVDSGGAYVATSAVIFYMWAYQADTGGGPELSDLAARGKEVLEPWLSEAEIRAAKDGSFEKAGMNWGSRERYVAWYAFLLKQVE